MLLFLLARDKKLCPACLKFPNKIEDLENRQKIIDNLKIMEENLKMLELKRQLKRNNSLWQKPDRTSPMLLEAPTGSGKTFIASLFIKAIKKLVTNDAKNRKLRNSENKYFENCLTQTRLSNQEIILIIDEAHKNKDTQLAKKVINLIDPKIIFYITATPKHRDKTKSLQTYYRIPFQEVAEQGLIKETIITPKNQIALKGSELDLTLLKMGVIKREELKTEYQLLKKDINPLLLIQLPDDTKGQIE
ncbi:15478_t:CDS:2 [Funneliformis geosporum]|uniref:15478_t:CDS:1 n=1 Tax=Funneliformis geosporum TaxID=1117311 RepID=A0A9W4WXX9_9GLOM|nr:15478_t:CDS:2 [Funneliformis geosporum]